MFDTADGRAPGEDVVTAMRSWAGANAVRVPLNEQCWLGIGGVSTKYGGEPYRAAVRDFVGLLGRYGFVAVLDLHRSAPGDARSTQQEQLPDRDHSPAFWTSVARTFAGADVVFDLFNEPFPFGEADSDRAWACWRDGGCQLTSVNSGQPYAAAGMTELIAAIRATGARNVVIAGGLNWAETLTRWLEYRPDDPLGQLGASFHGYSFNDRCVDVACYDRDLAPVAAEVPLLAGEIGPDLHLPGDQVDESCPASAVRRTTWSTTLLDWLDHHQASYTPWTWNPWGDCWSLTTDQSGTPTPIWGTEIRTRLSR